MKKINLTTVAILLAIVSYGQNPKAIFEKFKFDSLPVCVNYSHDEQVYFGAIYHTDTIEGEARDVFVENIDYQKDSSLLLTRDFVKQHLLPNTNFIYALDEKNNDTLYKEPFDDYLNADFYAISALLTTEVFYVVLYERVFAVSGIPSSEKFICTLTRSGKFISRNLIASFAFHGTSFSTSGAKVPWFPVESSCINRGLLIAFNSPIRGSITYKIERDGKIVVTQ